MPTSSSLPATYSAAARSPALVSRSPVLVVAMRSRSWQSATTSSVGDGMWRFMPFFLSPGRVWLAADAHLARRTLVRCTLDRHTLDPPGRPEEGQSGRGCQTGLAGYGDGMTNISSRTDNREAARRAAAAYTAAARDLESFLRRLSPVPTPAEIAAYDQLVSAEEDRHEERRAALSALGLAVPSVDSSGDEAG